MQRARVLKLDPANPCKMEQDFQFLLIKGEVPVTGRRIRFPRSGFEAALVETGRFAFTVAEAPPPGAVAKGDPFVVYSIQAEDLVVVPSRFACRGERGRDGELRLSLAATGAATLRIPGTYRTATVEAGGMCTQLTVQNLAAPATVVRADPAALKDGKGVVTLHP